MRPSSDERRTQLVAAARVFRDDDPDPATRAEVDALLARSDDAALAELEDRFGAALAFGTAGLRGLVGAGDNRMNRRVVAKTTAGLCAYLAREVPDARRHGICLACDGRHGSRGFSDEAAAVAWGLGFVVHRFEDLVPTPLLAFSVLDRGAAAGIMITASHNPAAYNGYKVYLQNGAQLASPHDRSIQAEIARVHAVASLRRCTAGEARAAGLAPPLTGVDERYLAAIAASVGRGDAPLQLRAAYTPLHGVGRATAERVFERIGARDVQSVPEQADPDPEFPTVAFPNPEEPGALDRLLAFGERIGADLALANDPDADRLAVAARDRSRALAPFNGNELGVLLADYLLARAPRDGKNLVVSTIVSTPLLERIAREYGAQCLRTLTGFKWIIGRALELERTLGLRRVFGFEEALGYCVGDVVRDKDGIGAAAHALRMAELHAAAGRTLHDALEALYRRYGLCHSTQVSFTRAGLAGVAEIAAAMARLRARPPEALAGIEVCAQRDLSRGTPELPPSDVVVLELAGEHRITVRPSGTEPKLKVYLDVWVVLTPQTLLASAQAEARALSERLQSAMAERLGV